MPFPRCSAYRPVRWNRRHRWSPGVESDYVSGVGKLQDRLLIMLDLDRLLSSEDMEALSCL